MGSRFASGPLKKSLRVVCRILCQDSTHGVPSKTFGLAVWEVFYILLAEKDKTMFMVYLRAFRDNLKRYKLQRLSQYFEETYFKPERIKQWACWYRLQMFNCEWILDTNMHVEAWHDVLKSHVMGKKRISGSTSYFAF